MSRKELDRVKVIQQVLEKRLDQKQAAKQMGVTDRQIRRLIKRFQEKGDIGLISSRRGKPSNNQLKQSIKHPVIDLVRNHYADFGPTLASEKLLERHELLVSNGMCLTAFASRSFQLFLSNLLRL